MSSRARHNNERGDEVDASEFDLGRWMRELDQVRKVRGVLEGA